MDLYFFKTKARRRTTTWTTEKGKKENAEQQKYRQEGRPHSSIQRTVKGGPEKNMEKKKDKEMPCRKKTSSRATTRTASFKVNTF